MELLFEIRERQSPRSFLPKPIQKEHLNLIFEAAQWAPSAFNSQPWRYFVADKFENEVFFNKILETMTEFNQKWASLAPVLVAVTCQKYYEHNQQLNLTAWYDCGLSTQNLIIQAMHLGISAHIMGGFDRDKLSKELNLPESMDCISIIAIGYQGSLELLPQEIRNIETDKKRIRKNLDEIIFNKPL
ncbi:MAG: nitroreductase family protein [Bacteroidales bacterium]|nr:nitroreductase family protein [Bacteroidales bacterium]